MWGKGITRYQPRDILQLSGGACFAWYSADYYDSTGAVSGGLRWFDRSGNEGHLDAASVASSPTPGTSAGLNNQPCLTADGVDDGLISILDNTAYNFLHDCSTEAAVILVRDGTSGEQFGGSSNTSSIGFNWYQNRMAISNGSGVSYSSTPLPLNRDDPQILACKLGDCSITGDCFVEDEADEVTASGSLVTGDCIVPFTIMKRAGVASYWAGDVSELIILKKPSSMSSSDFNEVIVNIKYSLAVKYGLRDFTPRLSTSILAKLGGLWVANYGITLDVGVSEWRDQSIWANHVVQTTTTAQPALTMLSNGNVAIQGASGDYLRKTTFNQGTIDQPGNLFVAGEWGPTTATNDVIVSGTTISDRWVLQQTAAGLFRGYAGVFLSVTPTISEDDAFVGSLDLNGTESEIDIDNGTSLTASGDIGSYGLSGITILANYAGSSSWTGKISGAAVINETLTDDEKEALKQFFKDYTI